MCIEKDEKPLEKSQSVRYVHHVQDKDSKWSSFLVD